MTGVTVTAHPASSSRAWATVSGPTPALPQAATPVPARNEASLIRTNSTARGRSLSGSTGNGRGSPVPSQAGHGAGLSAGSGGSTRSAESTGSPSASTTLAPGSTPPSTAPSTAPSAVPSLVPSLVPSAVGVVVVAYFSNSTRAWAGLARIPRARERRTSTGE